MIAELEFVPFPNMRRDSGRFVLFADWAFEFATESPEGAIVEVEGVVDDRAPPMEFEF